MGELDRATSGTGREMREERQEMETQGGKEESTARREREEEEANGDSE